MKIILTIFLSLIVSRTPIFAEASKLGRNAEVILQKMEKQIVEVKTKAIVLLEREMKTETQKGNLEGAIATKEIIEKLRLDTAASLFNGVWRLSYDNGNSVDLRVRHEGEKLIIKILAGNSSGLEYSAAWDPKRKVYVAENYNDGRSESYDFINGKIKVKHWHSAGTFESPNNIGNATPILR